MKYILFFIAAFSLTSCKKSYDCVCTGITGANIGRTTIPITYKATKKNKPEAQGMCKLQERSVNNTSNTYSCALD